MLSLKVNGTLHKIDVDPTTPILWVVREQLKLTGSKFGCGAGLCGACTVHLDGNAIRSCITPISAAQDKEITTIEGIGNHKSGLSPIQQIWIEEQIPQCGYCQSGQIMSATALITKTPYPSDEEIDQAMDGNICRCGMYGRIKKGIKRAVAELTTQPSKKMQNG